MSPPPSKSGPPTQTGPASAEGSLEDERILIIEDDESFRRLVAFELDGMGLTCEGAATAAEGLARIEAGIPGVVLLDLDLPDMGGQQVLERIRATWRHLPVIVLTGDDDVQSVVACMQSGATDYVHKPFEKTRLLTSVTNALEQSRLRRRVASLASELHGGERFGQFLGEAPCMMAALDLLRRAAANDVTVLVTGESGTGKEMAASALHAHSIRRSGPMIAVNCGALPENLVESELFGHERGAFTGAVSARQGVFERADGGTLFLDEVGELKLDLQVRLLRVLEERAITRVGGERQRDVDVRIVAATNRDLKAEIARGLFREDLYYRLAIFPVELPPLRERGADIGILAEHFLLKSATEYDRPILGITAEARRSLELYQWPGNVRELQNVIARATIVEDDERLSLISLPDDVVCAAYPHDQLDAPRRRTDDSGESERVDPGGIRPFAEEERAIVLRALQLTSWNVQDAARRLGIGRATIYRKIELYELAKPGDGDSHG